jgi:energy-coupling factor transport system permease protein
VSRPENKSGATLFVCRKTWLHRLHPFNKLAYILLTGVAVYLGPGAWYIEAILIVVNLGLAISGEVLQKTWGLVWRTLLPLAFFMIPIHGFLYPENRTILISLSGVHFYLEGFLFALNVLLQLTAVLTASLIFVLCTHPTDLITAISQAGLPQSLTYLIGSPMLLLPIMRTRIATIQDAQRSRGLDSEGSVLKRFLSLFPLAAPVVLGSLVEIEQRSIALETRGFSTPGPKTSFRTVSDTPRQQLLRWGMLSVSLLIIVYRIWK